MADHVENGFFVGGSWHGKGHNLETAPATVQECKAYGLGFEVLQAPVQFQRTLLQPSPDAQLLVSLQASVPADTTSLVRYNESDADDSDVLEASFDDGGESVSASDLLLDDNHALTTVPKVYVNYRSDTGAPLGVVKSRYVPAQFDDVFQPLQDLIDTGLISLTSGGVLKHGKIVWMCADIKDGSVDILPNDEVQAKLLIAHAHDGSMTIHVGVTYTRVVCWNTLTAAVMQDGNKMYKIRHTGSAVVNVKAAVEAIDIERKRLLASADIFRAMTRVELTEDQRRAYIRECLKPGAGSDKEMRVVNEDTVLGLLETGNGTQYGRGSLYHAFNAVTEYLSHYARRSYDGRMSALWFPQKNQNQLGRALIIANSLLQASGGCDYYQGVPNRDSIGHSLPLGTQIAGVQR